MNGYNADRKSNQGQNSGGNQTKNRSVGKSSRRRRREKRQKIIVAAMLCIVAVLVVVLAALLLLPPKDSKKPQPSDSLVQNSKEDNSTAQSDDQNTQPQTAADTQPQTTEAPDTQPPVISGVKDRTYHVGDTVLYLSGVSASDDRDQEVEVTVDKSQVNVNQAGSYKVYYTATDRAGNTAKAEATFTFELVLAQDATYQELAAQLLRQIIQPSMSQEQKLQKVYDYLFERLYYGNRKGGATWQEEAVLILKDLLSKSGKVYGDCFTSAAVSMAMLEAMGAQTQWMNNLGPSVCGSNHVWVLCNIGTGWYHFDITHMYVGGKRFMMTDAQLDAYAASHNLKNYLRDSSAYPATPTTAFAS